MACLQTAIVEAVKLGNADMVTALVVLFATNSANPYQVTPVLCVLYATYNSQTSKTLFSKF